MASKEKQIIVAARVHSKRESPGKQPSETGGRHASAAINCLTRCCEKSLVTIVAIIVSIAVPIAVVLVGKHLTQTYDHNKLKSVFQVFQVFVYLPKKAFKIPPNNG